MAKTLTVDGRELGAVSIDFLAESLAGLRSAQRSEVWMNDPAGPALAILKSGARALVMYLRREGDVGLTSRSIGDHVDGDLEFVLSNGQVDRYPAAWTVPFEDAMRAAEYFWFKADPSPSISWHDEAD